MAKIKLPSYIKEAGGKMDDAVLVTRKGVSYMMPYREKESYSDKQIEVQLAFSTIAGDWKNFTGIIQDTWEILAKDTTASGFNIFMGNNLKLRRAGEPLILCKGMGEEPLKDFTASPGTGAGEITCEFTPAETGRHITFFWHQVTEPGVKAPISRHDGGADTMSPFTISGLEQGLEYCVYTVVTDAQYDKAITVSESSGAKTNAG